MNNIVFRQIIDQFRNPFDANPSRDKKKKNKFRKQNFSNPNMLNLVSKNVKKSKVGKQKEKLVILIFRLFVLRDLECSEHYYS